MGRDEGVDGGGSCGVGDFGNFSSCLITLASGLGIRCVVGLCCCGRECDLLWCDEGAIESGRGELCTSTCDT